MDTATTARTGNKTPAIGAFYALPRTGAVSMETAITPLVGGEGFGANVTYNINVQKHVLNLCTR